jgi:carbamoyltransferase
MLVLGVHIGSGKTELAESGDDGFDDHDAAAVLVDDGRIVAAVEEERLSRIKHTNFFPARAIRWVLDEARVSLSDVAAIAVPMSELEAMREALRANLTGDERHADGRELLQSMFRRCVAPQASIASRIRFCTHHDAHAWSAFYPSGFDDALVISVDGAGGDGSGGTACMTIGRASKQPFMLEKLAVVPAGLSLGNYYTFFMSVLGYRRFDEYKVMGLAPYGDPARFREFFARTYELRERGQYSLGSFEQIAMMMIQEGLISAARKKGEPFSQLHKDYAAALQAWLETMFLHVVTHYRAATGLTRLCLAGGVAHNCTLNGRLLYSGMFDKIFVQPACHDAGIAYGAAIAALVKDGKARPAAPASHLSHGPDVPDTGEIERTLRSWSEWLTFERRPDIERETARLLAADHVVGWVQGRAEFGPRALGNRSILADPRPAENKARINSMVKKREGYRPFAPSVLEHRLHDVFDVPAGVAELKHMLYTVRVKEAHRAALGAITHIDGTARVQTVAASDNARYWKLLSEFDVLTGIPLVLNTSFNNNVEPIVTTVEEAIACFLTTDITALVVDDFLVRKRDAVFPVASCLRLKARIAPGRRLVRQHRFAGPSAAVAFALESTTTSFFLNKHIPISPLVYAALARGDDAPIGAEWNDGCVRRTEQLAEEVMQLWRQRAVVLAP